MRGRPPTFSQQDRKYLAELILEHDVRGAAAEVENLRLPADFKQNCTRIRNPFETRKTSQAGRVVS